MQEPSEEQKLDMTKMWWCRTEDEAISQEKVVEYMSQVQHYKGMDHKDQGSFSGCSTQPLWSPSDKGNRKRQWNTSEPPWSKPLSEPGNKPWEDLHLIRNLGSVTEHNKRWRKGGSWSRSWTRSELSNTKRPPPTIKGRWPKKGSETAKKNGDFYLTKVAEQTETAARKADFKSLYATNTQMKGRQSNANKPDRDKTG